MSVCLTSKNSRQILWQAVDAAAATGGRARGGVWAVSGISIDSREVQIGDLFVALKGPNYDGHDFIIQAFRNGASAGLVSRVPSKLDSDMPLIIVDDTNIALRDLAKAARERTSAKVIAVTGSVGKTGTKEMIAAGLVENGTTIASLGNQNNHIGVPLSLARMPKDCNFGVFEVGMSAPGEVANLTKLIRPHVGIITTVEPVHTEFFNSLEAVADAKGELFSGIINEGTAIINRDNFFFPHLLEKAQANENLKVMSFGSSEESDFKLIDLKTESDSINIKANLNGQEVEYIIKLRGRHWALNSVAALAASSLVGAGIDKSTKGLSRVMPMKGRGSIFSTSFGGGKISIIDESYNASPPSMEAALQSLGDFIADSKSRRVAILGDMLELGESEDQYHADLAPICEKYNVNLVRTVGPLMAHLHLALPASISSKHFADPKKLIMSLSNIILSGDIILVKGSKGSRVSQIIDYLTPVSGSSSAIGAEV